MKHRLLFLLLLISVASSQSFAQGLYVRIGGGYGLGASGEDYGNRLVYDSTGIVSNELIYGSNGKGGLFGLDIGYKIDDHIGFQVGVEYLKGANQTRLDYSLWNSNQLVSTQLIQEYSNQLRILPAVVINAGLGDIDPYCRVGVSIPLSTTTFISDISTNLIGMNLVPVFSETEIVGKFVLGYTGSFGCNFSLGSTLDLFAEVGAISQRLKGSSGKITTYTIDGVDELASIDVIGKEWNYLESVTSEDNNILLNSGVNLTQPEDRQQISQNLSSFYLKAGVKLYFGRVRSE